MALKRIVLVAFLAVVLAASQGEAQLLNSLTLLNITGHVACSVDGNVGPSFPNADVDLSCGGNAISSTVTNADGIFSILLNTVQTVLSNLGSCNVVVTTPLSSCNASLPTVGILEGSIQLVGSTQLQVNMLQLNTPIFNFTA